MIRRMKQMFGSLVRRKAPDDANSSPPPANPIDSHESAETAREANDLAREANSISVQAQRRSKIGNRIATLALLVSLASAAFGAWQAYEVRRANEISESQPGAEIAQRVLIDEVFLYSQLSSQKEAKDSPGVLVNLNNLPIRDVTLLFRRPMGWGGNWRSYFNPIVGSIDQIPGCSAVMLPNVSKTNSLTLVGIEFQTPDDRWWHTGSAGYPFPMSENEQKALGGEGRAATYFVSKLPRVSLPRCGS